MEIEIIHIEPLTRTYAMLALELSRSQCLENEKTRARDPSLSLLLSHTANSERKYHT